MKSYYSDPATPPVIQYEERFVTIRKLHTQDKPECGIPDCPCHQAALERAREEALLRTMEGSPGKVHLLECEQPLYQPWPLV